MTFDVRTRDELHRIAAHVLGRRRYEVAGRFGLRSTPNGFGTPAFGNAPTVVRVAGTCLVCEEGTSTTRTPIAGTSLRQLVEAAGARLDHEFHPGKDAPDLGDLDAPIELDTGTVEQVGAWFALGWTAIDALLAGLGYDAGEATLQLWPEHFDVGTNIALPSGDRVNLGFSAGDAYEPEPYLYFGPWSEERGGDPDFWNAPFGALRRASESLSVEECLDFFRAGLRNCG